MAIRGFNRERAATVLVEAAFVGDTRTAKKFGVTARSLVNWRKRLSSDEQFSSIFLEKLRLAERGWAERLTTPIIAASEFIGTAATTGSPRSPAMVEAIASALHVLLEAKFTRDLLDARLTQQDETGGQANQTMAAPTDTAQQI